MTVIAAEAADAGAGATAATRARRTRATPPRVRRTSGGSTVVSGSGGSRVSTSREGQRAVSRGRMRPLPPPRQTRQRSGPAEFRSNVGQASRSVPRAELTSYQPIILVEFVAAVLLVAATPIAVPKSKTALSPYAGSDMIKLAAITLVYLILAMLSAGSRSAGRFAAWFGALILLTVGLGEAANIATELGLGPSGSSKDDTGGAGGHKK